MIFEKNVLIICSRSVQKSDQPKKKKEKQLALISWTVMVT